jgi:predicted phosphodiesterase
VKIAIISDIHGNMEALKAVLADAQSGGVDRYFCLGDIVGYGPNPKECLDVTRGLTSDIVKGNHEEMVSVSNFDELGIEVNHLARSGVNFSRSQLSEEDKDFITSLPLVIVKEELDLSLAHGAFSKPQNWTYVFDEYEAQEQFSHFDTWLGFIGHTHVPFIFGSSDTSSYDHIKEGSVGLCDEERFLINVGSVGQPRDGDRRASYGILEIYNRVVCFTFRRVEYDIQKTVANIREARLPVRLGERLLEGR